MESHLDTEESDEDQAIDQAVQETRMRHAFAIQQAQQDAARSQERTETGTPINESAAQTEGQLTGGFSRTAPSLSILGAGQPYPSGSY